MPGKLRPGTERYQRHKARMLVYMRGVRADPILRRKELDRQIERRRRMVDQEAPVPLDPDLLKIARGAPANIIQSIYEEQAERNLSRLPFVEDVSTADPLTAKGSKIMAAMKEKYGERGEEVFYRSKNAGTITGVDMNADQTKPDDCADSDKDIGADPGVPPPEFNHPQQFPGASAPPEKATGDVGFGMRDAGPGYGGIVGGAIEQNWGDAMPPGMSLDQIQAESEKYWDQWKPLPSIGQVRTT
jgi:hypothetical protein